MRNLLFIFMLFSSSVFALSPQELNEIPLYSCATIKHVIIKKHETGFVAVNSIDYFAAVTIVKNATTYKITECPPRSAK